MWKKAVKKVKAVKKIEELPADNRRVRALVRNYIEHSKEVCFTSYSTLLTQHRVLVRTYIEHSKEVCFTSYNTLPNGHMT